MYIFLNLPLAHIHLGLCVLHVHLVVDEDRRHVGVSVSLRRSPDPVGPRRDRQRPSAQPLAPVRARPPQRTSVGVYLVHVIPAADLCRVGAREHDRQELDERKDGPHPRVPQEDGHDLPLELGLDDVEAAVRVDLVRDGLEALVEDAVAALFLWFEAARVGHRIVLRADVGGPPCLWEDEEEISDL